MSPAELQEMRNEVVDFMGHYADEQMIKHVYEMISSGADHETYLTPEQEAILDKRMELDKKGL